MIALIVILMVIAAAYLLSLRGRTGHPGLEGLRGWGYAHRGLHNEERPENSMAAFEAALAHGFGIEFDLHLLKDGNLAVIHDSQLLRTTGQPGIVEDLTTADLQNYHLQNTDQTIPEFRQVLELYAGKAPLIIELKSENGNYAALTETACRMMEGYTGPYCMESFDPYCVYWLKKHRPDIIRGQLSENALKRNSTFPWYVRFITTFYIENFLTLPDFIAHRYADRRNISVWLCRKLWHIQGVAWTLRSEKSYSSAAKKGWLPIFERFVP